MKREDWFPTPVWFEDLTDFTDEELDTLAEKWSTISKFNPSRTLSNVGGWQSQEMGETHCEQIETKLFDIVSRRVEVISKEISLKKDRKLKLNNWWVNVNNKGNYNRLHTHPLSILSGAFYIKVPQGDSGEIIFWRTNEQFLISSFTDNETPLTFTEVVYKPRRAMLLLFFSWNPHEVNPNNTDEERISISFNYS